MLNKSSARDPYELTSESDVKEHNSETIVDQKKVFVSVHYATRHARSKRGSYLLGALAIMWRT